MINRTRESLVNVEDSLLCLIDVQPGFADKLDDLTRVGLIERVAWIAALARVLSVPVVITEEEPERNGVTFPEVLAHVPEDASPYQKPTFGLADVPEISAAVAATERRTAILAGMETDVCVAHSALGLLDLGYRVVVVRDAVAAPGEGHDHGLERMRDAGVVLVGAKGLFYEWARTVERASALDDQMSRVPLPGGLTL
jgi:nicotinamidase-related amidase